MYDLTCIPFLMDVVSPTVTGSDIGDFILLILLFTLPVALAVLAIVLVLRRRKKKAALKAPEAFMQKDAPADDAAE